MEKWEPKVGSSCPDCGGLFTSHTENGKSFIDCEKRCLSRQKKSAPVKRAKDSGIETRMGF